VDHHQSIAILEDEALIALDVEDSLRDAGFKIAGVFSSCAGALNWFEGNSPDVVLMDIELADGDCVRIARLLLAREIPFVVHSASSASSGFHDPIFLHGRWVAKPAAPSDLRDAVRASLGVADDHIRALPRPYSARRGQAL
jgi:DNA-binding response OmpR family regulator